MVSFIRETLPPKTGREPPVARFTCNDAVDR